MKLKRFFVPIVAAVIGLSACDRPVDASLQSNVPAPAANFAVAQNALSICTQQITDRNGATQALQAIGFVDVTAENIGAIEYRGPNTVLEAKQNGTVVVLAGSGRERACFVGLRGMTPEQSFALAEPIAKQLGAVTNASLGQGLANNAVEAWRSDNGTRLIFIAAYRTWEFFDEPGAAVRVINRSR